MSDDQPRPGMKPAVRISLDKVDATLGDATLILGEIAPFLQDPDVTLAYRARLFDVQQSLNYAISLIDSAVIRLHPYDIERPPILLPGGGNVKIQGGNVPKRYDIPALESALAGGIAAYYEEDGLGVVDSDGAVESIDKLVREIVHHVIDSVGANAPSFTNFRKSIAKKYGVDITKYVTESEKSPLKVVIYGRGKEGIQDAES